MKKVLVFLFLGIFVILSACQKNVVNEPVVRSIEPEFFYAVTDTVVEGDNTWNRAKYFYGSGFKWTDIVNRNEFLQKPGRVWRDQVTGIWYCLILPGEVLDMGIVNVDPVFDETVIAYPIKSNFFSSLFELPWWVFLLIVLAIIALILAIRADKDSTKKKELHKEWGKDPVTSGKPQVSGGVPDSGAHIRAAEIIQNRFPSATFVVTKIYRGKLSGPAQVYYDGEIQPKERLLDNVDAYQGVSIVNGEEEIIYFLQGCGNDARWGNFMMGEDLIFSRTTEIGQDGSEIPLVQETTVDEPGTSAEIKKGVQVEKLKAAEVSDSELFRTITSHSMLVEEFLKNQTAHKVTLKVTTPQGTVETILEAKNESKQTDKKTIEEGPKK